MECNIKYIFGVLLFALFEYTAAADLATSKVSFIPKNYVLQIQTKEDHFNDDASKAKTFDGKVIVEFDMEKPADFQDNFQIILNTNPNMTKKAVTIEGLENESYEKIKGCKDDLKDDKLVLDCAKDVQYKTFKLTVEYSNPFGTDMTGFYRSSYKDSSNTTRWLLTTHFEPIFARKAFPCFDQPNLKANFEIHITVPKKIKTVLSNTVLRAKTPGESKEEETYSFKKTESPMSTYLVAFTLSNFTGTEKAEFESEYLQDKFTKKRALTTYGREDIIQSKQAQLAQTTGIEAVNQLTKYLELGYAFEKIDFVGIPDFSAGAMENWGHISFREKSLFFNEISGSTITKQANILTITHELVHQWFGNLVTLESWNYIWLNEAFATYIEYLIASSIKNPDTSKWNLMNQMVVNEIHLKAFETDGLNTSKPLNNIITDESLIFSSFNDIPYSKGAAVLRMWDLELKDGGFQKSLKEYLTQSKEKSANPGHLYSAFKAKADMNENTFKTWTEQPGYPVVEVKKINDTYHLSQTRFLWENFVDSLVWRIPITYSSDKSKNFDTVPSQWLYKDPLTLNHTCKWIIVNNQQAGYYRVNYDKENWVALSKALSEKNYSNIPELNRAQIINDIFSLARSLQKDYVSYSTALELAEYLKSETSLIVWKTALNALDFLNTKLFKDDVYVKFKKYVLSLVEPRFQSLNSTGLEHSEKLKNIEISRWACSLGSESCMKQAKDFFKNSSYSKLPDTQEIILCTVIRNNNNEWETVYNKYKEEQDSALKVMYISALGCTNNKSQAQEFLKKTLAEDSGIRKQDRIYVLSSMYNDNLNNIDIAFAFIENNFEGIAKHYGGINPLGKALVGIAKKLSSQDYVTKLENLAKKIKSNSETKAAVESIDSAVKIAKSNVNWVNKRMDECKKYLNSGSLASYSFALLLLSLISLFQF